MRSSISNRPIEFTISYAITTVNLAFIDSCLVLFESFDCDYLKTERSKSRGSNRWFLINVYMDYTDLGCGGRDGSPSGRQEQP